MSERRFKRYPAYKDSGVEWLGEIPAHWEVGPLFTLARERGARNVGGGETNVLSLSYGRIVRRDVSENFGLMPESFDTYQVVEPGNIVLRLTDLQNDKRSLRVGFVNERGIITSAYVALRLRARLVPEYASALLHAYDVTKVFYSLGGGVRQTMKFADLKWMPLLVPSVPEQRAIAAFLDRETARIDALVAKKERLIELLQEQRTALITRAVTKGLDPNVPVKDSGVEWLGEIPAHWEVKRVKQVAFVENSGAFGAEIGEGPVELPVCTTAHLTPDGQFLTDDMPRRAFSSSEAFRYVGVPGDILVVKSSGSNTNIISGKLGLIAADTPRLVFSNFLLRLRPTSLVAPAFLAYVLRSELTRERIQRMVATTTYPNIDVPEYVGCAISIPPVEEQKRIAALVDRETARIDTLVAKVRAAIDRLKELRTALISAAVTGKIDVREDAA